MTKKWTTHHFNLISDQLNSDEYVIFCFVGLHNYISSTKHDNNYAYALTNKRLIVAQQKMIGNNVQSIILDNLNNISKKRGILLGTLTIDTLGKVLNVAVDKDTVDRISDSLNEIIYNLKRRNISATNSNTSTISSASEIRKYKELLDDGIITEEEFNKKKQELLEI
nr:PH domain-containing protein [Enterococcus faecium]